MEKLTLKSILTAFFLLCLFNILTLAQPPDTLWTQLYTIEDSDERGHCVQQTSDGGYVVAGYLRPDEPYAQDLFLLKTDEIGDTLWTRIYEEEFDQWANSIRQAVDEGYIMTGGNKNGSGVSDLYLFKTNQDGDILWNRIYGGSGYEEGECVQITSDGGFIVVGRTTSQTVYQDIYLIRTDQNGDTLWTRRYGD